MNLLLLLMIGSSSQADAAFDRYEHYAKSLQVSRWQFTVTSPGANTSANGTLWLNRGKALRFDTKWRDEDYTLVIRDRQMIEVERKEKTYYEVQPVDWVGAMPSKIAVAPKFVFPGWVVLTDLRKGFDNTAHVSYAGTEKVGAVSCDHVKISISTREGVVNEDVWIEPSGKLAKLSLGVPMSPTKVWTIHEVQRLTAIPKNELYFDIPAGYTPHQFPQFLGPLAVDETFPVSGWKDSAGRSLKLNGKTFIAALGEQCEPSTRSLSALKGITGVRVVMLSDAKKTTHAGWYADAVGTSLTKLSLPATPTFFLVDGKGKITHLWMGYDPEKRDAFLKEIAEALKE